MAKLPDVYDLGPRPVPRPSRGMAQIGSADAVGRAVEGLGGAVGGIGEAIFDRETTAQATERDTMVAAQIRDLLYNPDTGFTALRGQAAVSQQERVMAQIDALQSSALEGLNGTARRKLEESLTRRLEGARQSVQVHTLGARDEWLAGASAARVEGAFQDSLVNPGATEQALQIITDETRARGVREGWDADRTAIEVQSATSRVFAGQIERIAAADPVQAMEYLRQNESRMLPSDVVTLEAKLQPAVRERVGRAIGASAYERDGVTDPAQRALAALEASTGQSFTINSAYRSPAENAAVHGADNSQHTHGNAFDIDVSGMSIEERQRLIVKAREAGFGGIGVYENSLHFDVGDTRFWGPDYHAGSLPEWAAEAVQAPRGTTPDTIGMSGLVNIEDPIEREAAMQEYDLRASIADGERKADLAAAQNAAFVLLESGGRVADIPLSVRQTLGEDAMTSLRAYERSIAAGVPVVTDPATYLSLRQQAADPAAFSNVNLMEYVDKLSPADFQEMVKLQTTPQTPPAINVPSVATMMSEASARLRDAGIIESDAPALYANFQAQYVRWADANKTDAADPVKRDAYVAQQLVPVVLNRSGWNDEISGRQFEIAYEGDPFDPADDVDVASMKGGALSIRGRVVVDAVIDEAARYEFTRLGRPPTAREVVDSILLSGAY